MSKCEYNAALSYVIGCILELAGVTNISELSDFEKLKLKQLSDAIYKAERYDEVIALHESDKAINDGLVKINKSLGQEIKVLKDGIKALLKYVSIEMDHYISEDGQDEYDFFSFYHNGNNCEDADYSLGDKDGFTKIKAILEVIEDEKHA